MTSSVAASSSDRLIPVVVVLGCWRGGTSCVAGVASHLGATFGSHFEAPSNSNPRGVFEERLLQKFCSGAFEEPTLRPLKSAVYIRRGLSRWLARSRRSAKESLMIGAKHPLLCLMIPEITEIWRPHYLIAVDRDIRSVSRSFDRYKWWKGHDPADFSSRLIRRRDRDLGNITHLRVAYEDLVTQPAINVRRIADFLGVQDPTVLRNAIQFVEPSLNRCDARGSR
jgi:Sulfotransferase family